MIEQFENRLAEWKKLRVILAYSADPIAEAVKFWNKVPTAKRSIDPYDQLTWPDPWEMIEENSYCEFTKLLAVAYTLMFIPQFEDCQPIFKIIVDKSQPRLYYMLLLDDNIVSLDNDNSMISLEKIPNDVHVQKTHVLKKSY